MNPIELRARREALGLSQAECARILNVAQNTISQWENGRRMVPDGVDADLAVLEDTLDRLVDNAVRAVESAGAESVLFAYDGDADLWAALPELDGTPAVVHRVALAHARRLAEVTTPPTIARKPD